MEILVLFLSRTGKPLLIGDLIVDLLVTSSFLKCFFMSVKQSYCYAVTFKLRNLTDSFLLIIGEKRLSAGALL